MSGLNRNPIKIFAAVAAVLLIAGVLFNDALARYVVISKMPPSYADKTQQRQFHNRVLKEYRGYQKHKSAQVRGWQAHVTSIKGQDQEAQLKALYKNAHGLVQYRTERKDVWSTPGETISRGYGDCDDYAHIYIVAAALLGFDYEHLWLMAGLVSAGGSKPIGHAIAVVETRDGRQFVLDNLYGRVVPESEHKRFKPVYSINIGNQVFYAQINSALAEAF